MQTRQRIFNFTQTQVLHFFVDEIWKFLTYHTPANGCKISKLANPVLKTRSSAIAEEPRDASCLLKSCQLSCNSAETTYTTSPDNNRWYEVGNFIGGNA